ncbi:hypothetical protein AeMF1_009988 [Aphanomyces euteiches]|nr:hypothetical protein AeMF1_009988 [Aphanomyces euteiches]KAH9196626.1 hypothetical protein AeNC1_001390 [Aphanomyces euteiches]
MDKTTHDEAPLAEREKTQAVSVRIQNALRRFTQKHIVSKLGHEEPAVFNHIEYENEKRKYMALLQHLKNQEASLCKLSQSMMRMCNHFDANERIKMDRSDTNLHDFLQRIQVHTSTLAPDVLTIALPSLQANIARMEDIEVRDNLEADFHIASHKYERAKRKGKIESMRETSAEMHRAQQALVVASHQLINDFQRVNQTKGQLTENSLRLACASIGHLMERMAHE